MASAITALQAWVMDTFYWSIFTVYSLTGALSGVATGSVHTVKVLAPKLTSVQGVKTLVSGEKPGHGSAPKGSSKETQALENLRSYEPKYTKENGYGGKPEGMKAHYGVEHPVTHHSHLNKPLSVAPATPPPTVPSTPAAPALNPVDLDAAFYTGAAPPVAVHPPSYPAPTYPAPPAVAPAPPAAVPHTIPVVKPVTVPADGWESASSVTPGHVTPGHDTGEDSAASLGSSPRSAVGDGEHHIKHPHMHKAKKGIKKLGTKIKKAFTPGHEGTTTA